MDGQPYSDDPAGWDTQAVTMLMDPDGGDDPDTVRRAVVLLRKAVAGAAADNTNRPGYVNNLGLALLTTWEWSHEDETLDESIDHFRTAIATTPADDPDQVLYQSNLGLALRTRFDVTGTLTDLDESIVIARVAAAEPPPDHPEAQAPRSNLGLALLARFQHVGDVADLDEAVDLLRQVVATTPEDHRGRVKHLVNLANALRARFDRRDAPADIDEAVTTMRAAITAIDDTNDPFHPRLVSDLGITLLARYHRTGAATDLDEAITHGQAALASASVGQSVRAAFLSNLGTGMLARFSRVGDVRDLDEAVALAREAVVATPDGDPDRASYLSNVGLALRTRFDHLGDLADVDEAAEAGRAAVAATPASAFADHADRAMHQSNLGLTLLSRFERVDETADINDAVAASREAVALTPADHRDYARYSSNLCGAAHARHGRLGDPADLDEAVAAGRAAVAATPHDDPDLALHLSNLATAMGTKLDRGDSEVDIDEAVELARRAAAATAPDHPNLAACLFNVGIALSVRHRRTGDRHDHAASTTAFAASAATNTAPPLVRVQAGRAQAELAAGIDDWAAAARAFDATLDLVPQLVDRRLGTESRQHNIGRIDELGTDAAAAALNAHAGREGAVRAVTALEQGRGILLSQGLDTRADAGDLRRRHADLAREFDQLRAVLNLDVAARAGEGGHGRPASAAGPAGLAERRRANNERWHRLLATIRAADGFARFLLPPAPDELTAAAEGGSIVAVNISRYRCDAIVITGEGIDSVPLPNLTQADVVSQANRFLNAVHDPDARHTDSLGTVLAWLWDAITEPVLAMLGHTASPAPDRPWPRVWWLPTGPLALLPLHAAGRDHGRAGARTVLDRVVSSYTPTIRALRHARRQPAPARRQPLLVAVPTAPGQAPLAHATDETWLVADLLGVTVSSAALVGTAATRTAVLARLTKASWAHFACHAEPAPDDPTDSCLVLHDGPVRVRELAAMDISHAQLAYLSSCSTSFGGTTLMDETLHVCSALQLAGFAHVIGALWPVSDRTARAFAEHTYRALVDGVTPAYAVHAATRRARAARPGHPLLWAAYQHVGP